jgi:co-chaperonin GroES (HSP10)
MIDQKAVALSISEKLAFEPVDDRILVKPLKPTMVWREFPIVPKEPVKDLEEGLPEATKFEKRKVETNVQQGVIIKLGEYYYRPEVTEKPFEIGDVICYHKGCGTPFDLFKDSRLLRRYEVLAKVTRNLTSQEVLAKAKA